MMLSGFCDLIPSPPQTPEQSPVPASATLLDSQLGKLCPGQSSRLCVYPVALPKGSNCSSLNTTDTSGRSVTATPCASGGRPSPTRPRHSSTGHLDHTPPCPSPPPSTSHNLLSFVPLLVPNSSCFSQLRQPSPCPDHQRVSPDCCLLTSHPLSFLLPVLRATSHGSF